MLICRPRAAPPLPGGAGGPAGSEGCLGGLRGWGGAKAGPGLPRGKGEGQRVRSSSGRSGVDRGYAGGLGAGAEPEHDAQRDSGPQSWCQAAESHGQAWARPLRGAPTGASVPTDGSHSAVSCLQDAAVRAWPTAHGCFPALLCPSFRLEPRECRVGVGVHGGDARPITPRLSGRSVP